MLICKCFRGWDCLAILLFLGYLWNNQFIELMIAWCLHRTSDLDLSSLHLALTCATWPGNACIQQTQIPEFQPTSPLSLPIWFLRNLPRVVTVKKKKTEKKLLALLLLCRPFYRLPPFSWRFLAPVRKRGFVPLLKWDLFRIFSAIGAHPTACNTQCRPTCCNLENSASQIFATQRSQLEKKQQGGNLG